MNISEANAVASMLRGDETAGDRQFLAERAGKVLQLSPLGLLAAHRPISHVLAGIDYAVTIKGPGYCREHGARRDECGCCPPEPHDIEECVCGDSFPTRDAFRAHVTNQQITKEARS